MWAATVEGWWVSLSFRLHDNAAERSCSMASQFGTSFVRLLAGQALDNELKRSFTLQCAAMVMEAAWAQFYRGPLQGHRSSHSRPQHAFGVLLTDAHSASPNEHHRQVNLTPTSVSCSFNMSYPIVFSDPHSSKPGRTPRPLAGQVSARKGLILLAMRLKVGVGIAGKLPRGVRGLYAYSAGLPLTVWRVRSGQKTS